MLTRLAIAFTMACAALCASAEAEERLAALIIDGQNNHAMWPKTTVMMKQYLEETGRFTVDVARTAYTWRGEDLIEQYPVEGVGESTAVNGPREDPGFKPEFSKYAVVVSNYNGAPWPQETQRALTDYVRDGGGFVVVHAANNAFGQWDQYNRMIGLGGWGGRTEETGPYVFLDEQGEVVRDTSRGRGGHHGPQHAFPIVVRDDTHPITQGMPREWMHARDELYDLLRGPAENMRILATAYADESKGGSGRHEPMIFTVRFGQGRVFHTPMGHADYSMECVGFIVTLQRGAEWAATGEVTQSEIPEDFPTPNRTSRRPFD